MNVTTDSHWLARARGAAELIRSGVVSYQHAKVIKSPMVVHSHNYLQNHDN